MEVNDHLEWEMSGAGSGDMSFGIFARYDWYNGSLLVSTEDETTVVPEQSDPREVALKIAKKYKAVVFLRPDGEKAAASPYIVTPMGVYKRVEDAPS